jgi:hypothetical protein
MSDSAQKCRLANEPDGRSVTARENLAVILERELLGPASGPNEILAGQPIPRI